MGVFKFIGLVILALILAVIIGIVFMSPKSYMERSVTVNAPPSQIYPYLINFRKINRWSPWASLDPDTEYNFSGPAEGPGARMTWHSTHEQVGDGEQWIMEVKKDEYVKSGIKFGGFEGDYFAEFKLTPTDNGTEVTWTYNGDVSNSSVGQQAMGKFFSLFMDSMLGPFYEDGLQSLKELVENPSPGDFSEPVPEADSVSTQ